MSYELQPLNFYPISFYFYFLYLWKQFYFWYTSLLLFPGRGPEKAHIVSQLPLVVNYSTTSKLLVCYEILFNLWTISRFLTAPTLISMFLWNCSSLNFPYWCSRLVLKSCKCVKYYFTTIFYFLHLFPRCAQETPGMFWDPYWSLPKYGVAIVYFPFRIHMISFNSSCWGSSQFG